ncbi:MAG: translation initiation factor eIF-2B [Candidatus Nanoarchaeia archaeon]
MDFNQILKDIKSLKIQGAENVARAGIKALKLRHDNSSISKIIAARPTEPCLRNAINFVLRDIKKNADLALKHFDDAQKMIATIGSRKIRNNDIIFTHCHSETVVGILKEAAKTRKFKVYCTETRPMYQGRKTAIDMAKARIPVRLFTDAAGRYAIKKSNLVFFGADAITAEGKIINKMGTEMFADIAEKYDIPVYFCTDSWKYDPMTVFGFEEAIEKREAKEVWNRPPKGIEISNIAFEMVEPELATGIISELGSYSPATFIEEVKKAYPWIQGER